MAVALSVGVVFTGPISRTHAAQAGDFTYEVTNSLVTITGYTGSEPNVTIPELIDGLPVTTVGNYTFRDNARLESITILGTVRAIGQAAFSNCRGLVDIAIPEGVTTIGRHAFASCSALVSVHLPSTLTTIDGWAFAGCSDLREISLPSGLTSIGMVAFADCASLAAVVVPATVATIQSGAFNGCAGLRELQMSDGVKAIEGGAFFRCSGLTQVDIPGSVTNIMGGAFAGCTSLVAIVVAASNPGYTSWEGVLFDKDGQILVQCPGGRVGIYAVPGQVTTILNSAFQGCSSLTQVIVGDAVNRIEHDAFSHCTGLIHVSMGTGVTSIEEYTFVNCTSLESIAIPDSVAILKRAAFAGCSSLYEVFIPESVTSIERGAFSSCTSLVRVEIPAGVTTLEHDPFFMCTHLKEIQVAALNPTYGSLDGVLFSKDLRVLYKFPSDKTDHYVVPDGVTTIGERAFNVCDRLVGVTVTETVTALGKEAFYRCPKLAGIYFSGDAPEPDSEDTFQQCDAAIVYYNPERGGWTPWYEGKFALPWIDAPVYGEWLPTTDLPTDYPDTVGEVDDPDTDGMSNHAEMLAGTDPADRHSCLILESTPRPDDLSEEDRTSLSEMLHAVYFRSVPGKRYGAQRANGIDGPWETTGVVTATTTQTRLEFGKPQLSTFYRVVLAQ